MAEEILAAHRRAGITPLTGLVPTLAQALVMLVIYRLARVPVIAGVHNIVFTATLFGAPLTSSLAALSMAGTAIPVVVVVLAVVLCVATFSSRQQSARLDPNFSQVGLVRLLPYSMLISAAVVPLALMLVLVTSSAWTLAERAVLQRVRLKDHHGYRPRPGFWPDDRRRPSTWTTGPRQMTAFRVSFHRGQTQLHRDLTGTCHVTAPHMTRSDSRGIPGRPRASRSMNGPWAEGLLRHWEHLVRRAEARIAAHVTGCPQCDGDEGLDSRDQLEALIRRGGRRGRRISERVEVLDERFRRTTTPSPFAPEGAGWWRYRNLD